MSDGTLRFTERTSTPGTPESGTWGLYATSDGFYVIDDAGATTGPLALAARDDYILIQDQKAQNTAGGTFTSGAWRTRDLNTEVVDTGDHASVGSNQITLAAGTYRYHILSPARAVDSHQAKLYNVTDAADIALGASGYSAGAGTADSPNYSTIIGRFTLTGSTVLEVRHYCQTTCNTNGFGVAANITTEIYTSAEFWRES